MNMSHWLPWKRTPSRRRRAARYCGPAEVLETRNLLSAVPLLDQLAASNIQADTAVVSGYVLAFQSEDVLIEMDVQNDGSVDSAMFTPPNNTFQQTIDIAGLSGRVDVAVRAVGTSPFDGSPVFGPWEIVSFQTAGAIRDDDPLPDPDIDYDDDLYGSPTLVYVTSSRNEIGLVVISGEVQANDPLDVSVMVEGVINAQINVQEDGSFYYVIPESEGVFGQCTVVAIDSLGGESNMAYLDIL